MKLRTIQTIYDTLNHTIFNGRLVRPTILKSRNTRLAGHYNYGGLSPAYMAFTDDTGSRAMRGTVYHEMIHQYLDEYLGIEDNGDHGDQFWLAYYTFANFTFDWEVPYA